MYTPEDQGGITKELRDDTPPSPSFMAFEISEISAYLNKDTKGLSTEGST